jgi:two-component system response regulator DevR
MTRTPAARIRLMLVDDHEVVRLGLRTLFGQAGNIDVLAEASTVAEAVLEASRVDVDVILMDMRLSDGTGLDACREIRSANPAARILFLTSYPDEEAAMATVIAGASGYLLKEIGQQALLDAIRRVANGESILEPTLAEGARRQVSALAGAGRLKRGDSSDELSAQESRVLGLVVEGKTNKEIALELALSDKTVKNYLSNAFQKLRVSRRAQAAAVYLRLRDKKVDG